MSNDPSYEHDGLVERYLGGEMTPDAAAWGELGFGAVIGLILCLVLWGA